MDEIDLNLTERAKQIAEELANPKVTHINEWDSFAGRMSQRQVSDTPEQIIHRHLTAITRELAGALDRLEHETCLHCNYMRSVAVSCKCGHFALRGTNDSLRHERDKLAGKVAEAQTAMRGLLLAADCTWYEKKLGHDWCEAVDDARAILDVYKAGFPPKQTRAELAGKVKELEAGRDSQGFPLGKQVFPHPKPMRPLSRGEEWSLLANQVVGAEVFPWARDQIKAWDVEIAELCNEVKRLRKENSAMAEKVKGLDRLWHEAKADALTQREMAQIYGEQRDELTIENANLRAELQAIKKARKIPPDESWKLHGPSGMPTENRGDKGSYYDDDRA